MNTLQSAWGNQILWQASLEQSLRVFVGKLQKSPFPTLEKYLENFHERKRKQIHIKKPAAEKGSPQNEKA